MVSATYLAACIRPPPIPSRPRFLTAISLDVWPPVSSHGTSERSPPLSRASKVAFALANLGPAESRLTISRVGGRVSVTSYPLLGLRGSEDPSARAAAIRRYRYSYRKPGLARTITLPLLLTSRKLSPSPLLSASLYHHGRHCSLARRRLWHCASKSSAKVKKTD